MIVLFYLFFVFLLMQRTGDEPVPIFSHFVSAPLSNISGM